MNRLSKYVEAMPFGRETNRVAYAVDVSALPEPTPGSEWRKVLRFNAGDEILRDPGLKQVFKTALATSCATVTRNTG
jgi:hypothetical protein